MEPKKSTKSLKCIRRRQKQRQEWNQSCFYDSHISNRPRPQLGVADLSSKSFFDAIVKRVANPRELQPNFNHNFRVFADNEQKKN